MKKSLLVAMFICIAISLMILITSCGEGGLSDGNNDTDGGSSDGVNNGETSGGSDAENGENSDTGTGQPAHKHTESDFLISKDATCAESGERYKKCTECGEVLLTETIEKLTEHTPGDATRENEIAADCKNEGSYDLVIRCEVCKSVTSSEHKTVAKEKHVPSDWITEKTATCTESGSRYKECTECFEKLETETVSPEHSYATVYELYDEKVYCGEEGNYYKIKRCTECGYEDEQLYLDLPEKHSMKDGKCEICALPETVLDGKTYYELNADGKSYTLVASHNVTVADAVIGVYKDLTVTVIDESAFEGGSNKFKSVLISDGVKTVGKKAFKYCETVETVTVGDRVVNIGDEAFMGCIKLKRIVLGESLESIGFNVFRDCSKLYRALFKTSWDWSRKTESGGNSSTNTIYARWILPEDENDVATEITAAQYLLEFKYRWYKK